MSPVPKSIIWFSTLNNIFLPGVLALDTDVGATAPHQHIPSKSSRIQGSFFGALVADALCLGSHYEYDAKIIKQAYGGDKAIQHLEYLGPGEKMGGSTHGVGWGRRNYHPGQKRGDNTDYGLYNELVLDFLGEEVKEVGGPL